MNREDGRVKGCGSMDMHRDWESDYRDVKQLNDRYENQLKCYEEKEKSLLGQIEDLKQTIKTLSKLI